MVSCDAHPPNGPRAGVWGIPLNLQWPFPGGQPQQAMRADGGGTRRPSLAAGETGAPAVNTDAPAVAQRPRRLAQNTLMVRRVVRAR